MRLLKIAAASVNQSAADWDGNPQRIAAAIETARAAGVSLLVLPELCITGYGCEDRFFSPGVARRALAALLALQPMTKGMAVVVGLPVRRRKALYNCAALLVDGRIAGFVPKRFLANDGIHYEDRWFKRWKRGRVTSISVDGREVPFGDIHFDVGGVLVGMEVCEDAWVPNRPGRELAHQGVHIVANPSASHFAPKKIRVREGFVIEGSRSFGAAYIFANLLGNEAGRVIFDGNCMIADDGEVIARTPRFVFRDWTLCSAVVDIDTIDNRMVRMASFEPRQDKDLSCIRVDYRFQDAAWEDPDGEGGLPDWELRRWSGEREYEEFLRAEALALFDYLRKSNSQGFVVSLSGGADSSLVSLLVACMVHLVSKELGLDGFKAKLSHIAAIQGARSAEEVIRNLLLCCYQRTENSSEATERSARLLAECIGAEFHSMNVQPVFDWYRREFIEPVIGRELSWDTPEDDLPLQNIQPRIRVPGIWGVANVKNRLLLTTSNRTEAAVGYCTMDGDTAGCLNPIGSVDKPFIRRFLRWMHDAGPLGLGNFAAAGLKLVAVELEPSAEIRPRAKAQTDEKDLGPLDVLEMIEDLALGATSYEPLEVFKVLWNRYPRYSAQDLHLWTRRFFRLLAANQWKRERLAVSFHMGRRNLDPRSWFRHPIIGGGYRAEVAELDDYVKSHASELVRK